MITVWMTGLSGAGKTTLASHLHNYLSSMECRSVVLDGDSVRGGLCSDLGFSSQDRSENIRRVAEVCRLLNEQNIIVIAALISPLAADRARAKKIIGDSRFREVYLSTPLAACEERDPKGLYRKARAGILPEFTGIGSAYEPPMQPDLCLDTSSVSLSTALARLAEFCLPASTTLPVSMTAIKTPASR